jgi:uncharacterized protein (DUF433 family)
VQQFQADFAALSGKWRYDWIMTTPSHTWTYLERDPKSAYKQLSIKGRRIKARTLYGWYMSEEEPLTIEQIAAEYELPIEAVKEAITYCQSDPPEIREDFEREQASMKAMGLLDSKNQSPARIHGA